VVFSGKQKFVEPFWVADVLGLCFVFLHSKTTPERVETQLSELAAARILGNFLLLQQDTFMAVEVMNELIQLLVSFNSIRFSGRFGLDFEMGVDVVGEKNSALFMLVVPNLLDVGDLY